MTERIKGRFTGMRALRLDKVLQQFLAESGGPSVGLTEIHSWITSGAVNIDGTTYRNIEKLVQPGSFLTVRPKTE
ncbi:MAG: hypothetical protein KDD64_14010 [Bdellovibrionales bacterium]|nr:hypothetical protein [Bdellovibrionales bacterium]